ncbi:MAG: C4-dicarboxylate ABC transporter, partial [Natronospirillum sp.]|nr:C4-dicarboxylate ABC transporter [Natronospirillum sp.]
LLVNTEAWEDLSDLTRAQIEVGCRSATLFGFSESEWENPQAMLDFEAEGVNLQVLSPEILAELEEVTNETLDEIAAGDEMFARVLESQREWMQIHGVWHDKGHLPRSYYGGIAE